MNVLVTGGAGFIGSRLARSAVGWIVPLHGPGLLLLQGLRPRTPVRADESDAGGDLP
jgi:nucleoside-diphosphate-sugar epimerase